MNSQSTLTLTISLLPTFAWNLSITLEYSVLPESTGTTTRLSESFIVDHPDGGSKVESAQDRKHTDHFYLHVTWQNYSWCLDAKISLKLQLYVRQNKIYSWFIYPIIWCFNFQIKLVKNCSIYQDTIVYAQNYQLTYIFSCVYCEEKNYAVYKLSIREINVLYLFQIKHRCSELFELMY